MSLSAIQRVSLTITVSGGTGEAKFNGFGILALVAIQPPAGNATYDFEIMDDASFGVGGRINMTGNTTLEINTPITGDYTFIMANAGTDGTYQVRLWIVRGYSV